MKTNALAKWFCAVADAYGDGKMPWAYNDQGRSVAVEMYNLFHRRMCEEDADDHFVEWCQRIAGISLKKVKR